MSFYIKIKKRLLERRYRDREVFLELLNAVDLSTPVEKASFIVFDTETTGLHPKRDELISLGALRIENLTLDLSSSFHEFLLPKRLNPESVEVHGITMEELRQKAKRLEDVLEDFLNYARGSVLVGFNVEFDAKVLDRYVRTVFAFPLPFYRLDVFRMWTRTGREGKSLKEIAQELEIPTAALHSALDDAYITALLFLKLAHRLREEPVGRLPLML